MTSAIRIIGIGSPVAGDELGMQLVERLRTAPHWQRRHDVEWLILERPGAALLHYLDGAQTVCIVDAVEGGGGDGVVRLELAQLLAQNGSLSSHQLGVAAALQLAAALQQLPHRLLIYGVSDTPRCFDELDAALVADLDGAGREVTRQSRG